MRIFILLFFLPAALLAQDVTISQPSAWIEEKVLELPSNQPSGSVHYLLLDYQDNVVKEESYSHIAYRVLNDEGVQSYSNISVDFDPSYQSLIFHQIVIRRNDEIIDKLKLSEINSIQRESDMSRNLYDGSVTSYINLTDVRSGDVIEYSYTLNGFNPIFEGNYSSSYYQDYTVDVDRFSLRVISDIPLYFKSINNAESPKKSGNEYTVDINPELIQFESNTPGWYNPLRLLHISTYKDWSHVASWAIPLYQLSKDEIEKVSTEIRSEIGFKNEMEEDIIAAIRFVQDDIRYLGFESGIKGYKPHKPSLVLDRRFGDCKDKSTLLVALLQSLGVEAYPMLVSTYKKESIENEQASPYAFDHCVVNFQFSNQSYFVDPTISNQGGGLGEVQFPNYERGLIVRSGSSSLTATGRTQMYKQLVEETLTVKGTTADAKVLMDVKTTYYYASADNMRSYFKNNSLPSITSEYTTFYSNLYPNIKSTKEVEVLDLRDSSNELVVEEQYEIENFWSEYNETGLIGEAYGLLVETYLSPKVPSVRSMPYFLGGPKEIEERVTFIMPEPWNVTESNVEIEGLGFHYESGATGNDNTIDLSYSFRLDSSFLSPAGAKDFLEKRESIQNDLSFNITYGGEVINSSKINWVVLIVTVLSLIGSLFLARNIYNNYNPDSEHPEQNKQIGGWLILFAIGLTLSPLRMAYEFTDLTEYWLASSWQNLKLAYPDEFVALSSLIIAELVFNTVFIVFSVLVVVAFYQRKTSAPFLISLFLMLNIAFVVVDAIILEMILHDDSFSNSIGGVVRSVIYAAIWISYLHNSRRVKTTFTNQ